MYQMKDCLLWVIWKVTYLVVKSRIFRISFSGELAYEVNVESGNGNFMWEKIIESW